MKNLSLIFCFVASSLMSAPKSTPLIGCACDQVWTNDSGVIHPLNTTPFLIQPSGSLYMGNNAVAAFGNDPGINFFNDFSLTGNSESAFYFSSVDGLGVPGHSPTNGGFAQIFCQSGQGSSGYAYFSLTANNSESAWLLEADVFKDYARLQARSNTKTYMLLEPTANGWTPYVFDTLFPSVSGNLLELSNGGEQKLSVSHDGAVTTGNPSSGSGAWKLGKVITGNPVTITTDKWVEVEIDGVIVKLAIVQ